MKRYRPFTVEKAKDVLADVLRQLDHVPSTKGWRGNLAYHLERKTKILCGRRSYEFTDGTGAG